MFSLGSVLGFAATGRPPFGSDSAVSIMFRVVNQSPDLAGVADAKLRELIAGCLAKSPRDRPPVRVILAALSSEVPVAPGSVRAPCNAPEDPVGGATACPGERVMGLPPHPRRGSRARPALDFFSADLLNGTAVAASGWTGPWHGISGT